MEKCNVELLNSYIDNELNDVDKIKFERHMAGCSDCRTQYEQTHRLKDMFESIPQEEPPLELKSLLHNRLVEESTAVNRSYKQIQMKKFLNYGYVAAAVILIAIFTKPFLIDNILGSSNNSMKVDKSALSETLDSRSDSGVMKEWIEDGTQGNAKAESKSTTQRDRVSASDEALVGAGNQLTKSKSTENAKMAPTGVAKPSVVNPISGTIPKTGTTGAYNNTQGGSAGAGAQNKASTATKPNSAPQLKATVTFPTIVPQPATRSANTFTFAPSTQNSMAANQDLASVEPSMTESNLEGMPAVDTGEVAAEPEYSIAIYTEEVDTMFKKVTELVTKNKWNVIESVPDSGTILIETKGSEVTNIILELRSITQKLSAPAFSDVNLPKVLVKIEVKG